MPDPQPWEQRFQAAREAVYKLAASGGRSFRMTIPPQPDDTDTLLCGVLDASQAEIARLRQEMKRAWGRLANHLLDHRNDGLVWEAADIITAALIATAPDGQEP